MIYFKISFRWKLWGILKIFNISNTSIEISCQSIGLSTYAIHFREIHFNDNFYENSGMTWELSQWSFFLAISNKPVRENVINIYQN